MSDQKNLSDSGRITITNGKLNVPDNISSLLLRETGQEEISGVLHNTYLIQQ